ncbi:peptide/nickel transport system permease protein [Sporobacter termitidis DSM 10068]|uniref:Peptide/nickel transport system permease protein n=1 Tax=Sporobacter termitidis DSM 10068 TaxID=1123282 RepID=A0A1M5XBH5_9FIRM|nr:ABC transporter permease [Sporobacter termitidis]SHH97227.1 peptide/nickel transport system permease protein [Sporobacter termitidis DSM 10068]
MKQNKIKIRRGIPPLILFLMATFLLIAIVSLLAPVLFPVDLKDTDLMLRLKPPKFVDPQSPYLFGTDSLGRDVATRLLYATRTSLIISVSGMLLAVLLGLVVGVVSGLGRGAVDLSLMFVTDAELSVPTTFIGIVCATMMGANALTTIIVIGVTGWPGFARLVRGQVMQIRNISFIECSRALGASKPRIFFEHILSNIASPLIVQTTVSLGAFILLESTLSYLGLGIQPPETSLGVMVSEGRDYMLQNWWLAIIPSLVIVVLLMQISLVGDWLRDRLDPQLKSKR